MGFLYFIVFFSSTRKKSSDHKKKQKSPAQRPPLSPRPKRSPVKLRLRLLRPLAPRSSAGDPAPSPSAKSRSTKSPLTSSCVRLPSNASSVNSPPATRTVSAGKLPPLLLSKKQLKPTSLVSSVMPTSALSTPSVSPSWLVIFNSLAVSVANVLNQKSS